MHKNRKLFLAAALILSLGTSGLTGCGAKPEEKTADMVVKDEGDTGAAAKEDSQKAMGRYLEEDIVIPGGAMSVEAMEFLKDKTLKIIYRNKDYEMCIASSKDRGKSWEEQGTISSIAGLSQDAEVTSPAIAGDGGIFAISRVYPDPDNWEEEISTYLYISPQKEVKELDFSNDLGETYVFSSKFTPGGNIILRTTNKGLKEFNIQDGSLVHSYEDGEAVDVFGIAGNRLIAAVGGTLHYYDLESGSPATDEEAFTREISAVPENITLTSTNYVPMVFAGGNEEGSVFCITHDGVYRYAFGGNMVEQVIDGSLNTIGSPDTMLTSFAVDDENNFYMGTINFDGKETILYKYVYSPDTPAVPDTELKVYSLKENSLIRQAAAVFQKKNPDIYLNLETGMTGEDAITTTDALKMLNTEIMAEKGPDIMILDGIPTDTYVEKGMLMDLQDILSETPLLENIKSCFTKEDGAVYTLPVKFGIPLLVGSKEVTDSISDLTSMTEVIKSHQAEYTENFLPVEQIYTPQFLLKGMADVSSGAWLHEDGTLNEEKIKEYLEQINTIYQSAKPSVDAMVEKYAAENGVDTGTIEDMLTYDESIGVSYLAAGAAYQKTLLAAGNLYSVNDLANLKSLEQVASITDRLWDGQAKNCFLPVNIIGISAKSKEAEAAKKFVEFLLSEDGQEIGRESGFPVTKSVYENLDYWKIAEEGTVLSVTSSYNHETGEDYSLEIKMPGDEELKRIQELGKTLTMPVMDNEIILNAVCENGRQYLKGEKGLDEAVQSIIQEVNLYLSE